MLLWLLVEVGCCDGGAVLNPVVRNTQLPGIDRFVDVGGMTVENKLPCKKQARILCCFLRVADMDDPRIAVTVYGSDNEDVI